MCKITLFFAYLQIFYYFCSVKVKIYIILALCCISVTALAENKWDHITWRNEIRIGWGDQLFESLMWHNPTSIVTTMPASYERTYHENFHYDQHLWAEYQWRFSHWFSFGGMVDLSEVHWHDVTRNGTGAEINRSKGHYFYNVVFMPTIRFTYFFHPNVNIYSGIGFGLDINGGSEANIKGKKTDVGAAVQLTVLGVSANYDRWFWTVDLGGLYALKDANTIFLASSRMISVGLGARF